MQFQEVEVDLFNDGQLDEHFLTKVNRKGQVPALTAPTLDKPMADSLEITHYLIEHYPDLTPKEHKDESLRLLRAVHALNYFALSFPDRPHVVAGFVKSINDRLARDDISDEYRSALEYKLSVTNAEKVEGIRPEAVRANEEAARNLMKTCEALLSEDAPWLFGSSRPTVLDAHLIIVLGRLQDVGRTAVVPDRLQKYADMAFATPELQSVMQGRRTMVPKSGST
ncbi:hypothetical protein H2204_003772 [Knufia peltigerae]|uniref:GST N-terminal domain-containing protein n=1 Tax=Knufia peltigerae TaxID=1002370 RepID=A0AA38Y8V9_9EURO|nr:hypothetical protein H2204_003772 [Knufia peltigerae]